MNSSHTVCVSTINGMVNARMVNAGEARGGQMGEGGRVRLTPSSARLWPYEAFPAHPLPETELSWGSVLQKGQRDQKGPCDFPALSGCDLACGWFTTTSSALSLYCPKADKGADLSTGGNTPWGP